MSQQIAMHYLPNPDGHSTYSSKLCPWVPRHGVSQMRTLRIPLREFRADLSRVTRVIIHLDGYGLEDETVYLDNLQFEGATERLPFRVSGCNGVDAPEPPVRRPRVPAVNPSAGICGADSGAEIWTRLFDESCDQIVLSAGDFYMDNGLPLRVNRPVTITGQGASTVVHFGIDLRAPGPDHAGSSGSSLRNLRVVVDEDTPLLDQNGFSYAVGFWEASGATVGVRDIRIEDVHVDGGGIVDQGIVGTAPRGAELRRI